MKLFPTIARDLADRDLRLRPLLVEVTTNNHSLRDTADVIAQWEKLILQPLSQLKGSHIGNVVVVIDALDESGVERTRATVLRVLAACGGELPANIRILLTSRPLVDIGEALNTSSHTYARSLDAIDTELTMRDLHLYVSTRLLSLRDTFSNENLQQLAAKSGGVFEWARLACDFISPRIGVIPNDRFHEIMSHALGDGRTLLDEMYTTFLKDLFREPDDRRVFRDVMRQILWLKEPLPITALDYMRDSFPREDDRYPVGFILNFMASLLAGVNEVSPVRPLHASFYDFLLDEKKSKAETSLFSRVMHIVILLSPHFLSCKLAFISTSVDWKHHIYPTWRWQTWKRESKKTFHHICCIHVDSGQSISKVQHLIQTWHNW